MPSFRERLTEFVGERTGLAIENRERLELLEASDFERRALQRELDLLAYTALDYVGGQPQELRAVERRKLAQKARIVWMRDPLAGAAVDLMNDFTFGRGLPKPKANDKLVQKVLDEAWDDPDNQEILTSLDAQVRLGTDLSLQANLFLKVFDDGDDGKVKLSLLKNDLVETVVRDPEVWQRVMWFVCQPDPYQDWDYKTDQPVVDLRAKTEVSKKVYYPHWRNVDLMIEEVQERQRQRPNMPEPDRVGEAKVFHIAINRTSDMALGHPPMDRLLRWFNAYNRFMDARVDIMEAAASFIMKRKVRGTPAQLQKIATQALSRRSSLGSVRDPDAVAGLGPGTASVITENENVDHEPFKLDTGSANAAQDGGMLLGNISAGIRFPKSYVGDPSDSSLATATSLELPVLKAVESRQEKFEAAVRFFCDRVIERAVDTDRIPSELSDAERADLDAEKTKDLQTDLPDESQPPLGMGEAHEDAVADEADTERDLGYEFSMPSPLKRMMTDLITSVQTVAQTFDPNNTNTELSRVLLGIALGDGLELEDPQGAVEKIFPPGYVDPAVEAAQQQASEFGPNQQSPPSQAGGVPPGGVPSPGADGQQHQEANPYGAPMQASSPDAMGMTEARTVGRSGEPIVWISEAATRRLPPELRKRMDARKEEIERDFDVAGAYERSERPDGS